jgi:hypothetical protein
VLPRQPDYNKVPGRDVPVRPRAHRFGLKVAVVYRQPGDAAWLRGTTVNVSRTGVLFQAHLPAVAGMPIQVELRFRGPVANVSCSAQVVRATEIDWDRLGGRWLIAAAIKKYSLKRKHPRPAI